MARTRRSSPSSNRVYKGQYRFEHWYRDNQVYFITARCKDRTPALTTEQAKTIFWDRFHHWTHAYGFTPWVTSLLDNHYHTLGYLREGHNLGPMMQRVHGSIAKLVNDTLPRRLQPFFKDDRHRDYFDGCLRDEKQGRATYRYVCIQSQRHGFASDWRVYPHTRIHVELEPAIKRALELGAFLEGVPYKRYRDGRQGA